MTAGQWGVEPWLVAFTPQSDEFGNNAVYYKPYQFATAVFYIDKWLNANNNWPSAKGGSQLLNQPLGNNSTRLLDE